MLKQYLEKDKLEVGIDEVGRGCLLGPVCVAGCVWIDEDPIDSTIHKEYTIKDSKKCSEKNLQLLEEYIKENCISYTVKILDNDEIDNINILQATFKCMHMCLDDILDNIDVDNILIDGNRFEWYMDKNGNVRSHTCIINGDNTYKSIACASIIAKTYRDKYIIDLVKDNPELEKYDILNNKGYGTKKHINAIKEYGLTKWHRKTFGICKDFC